MQDYEVTNSDIIQFGRGWKEELARMLRQGRLHRADIDPGSQNLGFTTGEIAALCYGILKYASWLAQNGGQETPLVINSSVLSHAGQYCARAERNMILAKRGFLRKLARFSRVENEELKSIELLSDCFDTINHQFLRHLFLCRQAFMRGNDSGWIRLDIHTRRFVVDFFRYFVESDSDEVAKKLEEDKDKKFLGAGADYFHKLTEEGAFSQRGATTYQIASVHSMISATRSKWSGNQASRAFAASFVAGEQLVPPEQARAIYGVLCPKDEFKLNTPPVREDDDDEDGNYPLLNDAKHLLGMIEAKERDREMPRARGNSRRNAQPEPKDDDDSVQTTIIDGLEYIIEKRGPQGY